MASSDLSQSLDIATPERVALDLPIAGLGYRTLAYAVDFFVLFAFWILLLFLLSLATSDLLGHFQALSGLLQTLLVVAVFATQWIFWTAFEGLGGGQTLGKRALKIRVVRDDGSPIGIFEAAVRNLARLVDFLPSFYGLGLLTMLFSRENRRVGDWLAGTVVIRDVAADLDRYTLAPGNAQASAPSAALSPRELELLLDFLKRGPHLEPTHRTGLSERMIARFCPDLSADERASVAADWSRTEALLRAKASGLR